MTRFIRYNTTDFNIGDTIIINSELDNRETVLYTRIIGKKNGVLLLKDSYVGKIKKIEKPEMQPAF